MKKNKNWLNDAEISQNYLDTLNTEGEIAAFKLGWQHGAKAALNQITKRLEESNESQSSRVTVYEEKIEDIKVGLTS
tara:strand:- start:2049 stop:2279 length:231 start_codon:yes stop_codon:yes gene_type:complete